MRRSVLILFWLAVAQLAAAGAVRAEGAAVDPAVEAGREIWLKATGGSHRLLSSLRPALTGGPVDWAAALSADRRDRLFDVWGLVPSPDCCVPGADACPASSAEETYGFAWCEGDDALLKHVGKPGYIDPACSLADAPLDRDHPHGTSEQRESACALAFGTSAGAVGLRKFPNPRFDAERWTDAAGWAGWMRPETADGLPAQPDMSVEPPFLIGLSCAACHAGPDPETPPEDPANPAWDDVSLLAGNLWSRLSALLATGLPPHDLAARRMASARPGTAALSPVPSDGGADPVAIPPILGSAARPIFEHEVMRWRPVALCVEGSGNTGCWCEPARPGKCWERRREVERVPHLGYGGEDAAGLESAVQRAYLAMGSCAATCEAVPAAAGSSLAGGHGVASVDPGLCRMDCPAFRAIEDRLTQITAFMETGRPASLWRARGLGDDRDLEIALDTAYFPDAVQEGRAIYARHCARCHSSQEGELDNAVFDLKGNGGTLLDWMGRETLYPVGEIGTDAARARQDGFAEGGPWQAFGSASRETRQTGPVYRAPTLRGIWATAPYLHNNAVGPELCGAAMVGGPLPWRSPHVSDDGLPAENPPKCVGFSPSVRDRYRMFEASMSALLSPARRIAKAAILNRPAAIEAGPSTLYSGTELGLRFILPAGVQADLATGLDYQRIVTDLGLDGARVDAKYAGLPAEQRRVLAAGIAEARNLIAGAGSISRLRVMSGLDRVAAITGPGEIGFDSAFLSTFYLTGGAISNIGHRFGESLSGHEKRALIAFLATL